MAALSAEDLDAAADAILERARATVSPGGSYEVPVLDLRNGYGEQLADALRGRGFSARYLAGGPYELDGIEHESNCGMLQINRAYPLPAADGMQVGAGPADEETEVDR